MIIVSGLAGRVVWGVGGGDYFINGGSFIINGGSSIVNAATSMIYTGSCIIIGRQVVVGSFNR